ncbi:WG repeat-containing protein [Hymenobacter sp. BT730]|uniref:WG repeat-containing protein n=1 Tax=Hymenobacter sp. BT730 TaxID=3063332 RepID=UPI0026E025AD|nr:WG repeat-containing protein [Hymenobacter sp. BT730]
MKNWLLIVLLGLITMAFTPAREWVSGELIPFRQGVKWGYTDRNRRLVLPLLYDEAGPFVEELAWVRVAGLYGYIDGSGYAVTPTHFTKASNFNRGRARVELHGETFDIDVAGKRLPAAAPTPEVEYLSLGDLVRKDGKLGFRFSVGSATVPPLYDEILEDYRGLLFVRQGQQWGAINRKGKLVLPVLYESIQATASNDFIFPIVLQAGLFGYLDAEGHLLVKPKYRAAEPFVGGVARVETPDGRVGYIDSNGKEYFE